MNQFKGLIYIIIFMISFFNTVNAEYEKIFFDFEIKDINEKTFALENFKNKAVLLVNVASNCGFTKQYSELQELYDKYSVKGLVVLGVPSNQFGGQEPGSNNEIKDFCETNFNITFPMTAKINVKGENAHPIYLWAKENYGNSAVPKWNFHKILINKDGKIEDTYSSFTKPMSKKLINKIEEIL
ncbi:glutathione peroxidase [Candidatus Pelagibacter sp. HIMB1321]|uniref:glutathione peroxidase n=1 Tax=Candidatus Pelagibacter sp. HIMB1321 TaxID=1388755 RepID=UPI000A07ED29|nr:glutathione peroxidase [Candidatus Pelagibacter sp. HIMB1321]SMF75449.1 glutathione peroxidase [Candidatus Pelagibacter sp. HIMB1321]